MKKRLMAVLLSVATMTSILGGCGQKEAGGQDAATNKDAGAENAGVDFGEEPYEATLMYWVANDARDVDSVEAALNELTLAQLNIKVDLMPLTLGTYGQQIQMVLSSDDALDIFPFWGSNIGSYIDAEYLVDLSEYLEDYGQDLINIIGMDDIMCCSVDGFLTGVPTMHERTNPAAVVLRTDLLEESGYTADDIKTMEDLTPIFEAVHQKHPEMTMYGCVNSMSYPNIIHAYMDPMSGSAFGVLPDMGQTTTVTNWYESDTFRDACMLVREWNQKGYTSADFATCSDSGESLMRAGNLFCFTTLGKPNTKQEKDSMTGYDTTCINIAPDVCKTDTTNTCIYGISSNAKDPVKAMMLLNWIYATKEANDLLNWGVEGKDYIVTEDGTIDYPDGVTAESVGYHQDYGWAQMNQFNSYAWAGNDPNVWDKYQEVRDNAVISKAYGFFFDTTPVLNELAALGTVSDEYLMSLVTGSVDVDKTLAEFNEKLYKAGLQKVIDEKQAQLDAWLEEQ